MTAWSDVADMALDPLQHQGFFGEAFVQVLATAAGLVVTKSYQDVLVQDLRLTLPGKVGAIRDREIAVQVKSAAKSDVDWDSGHWTYRLEAEHFRKLAANDLSVPLLLMLVIVPKDWQEYAASRKGELLLRHSTYWLSLADRDPAEIGERQKITVHVPADNIVTVQTIRDLILAATEGRI